MTTPRIQETLTYQVSTTNDNHTHVVRDGANRVLLVEMMGRFASVTSISYGGNALTQVVGANAGAGTVGTAHRHVDLWYLIAPAVGSATLNVQISGNTQGTVRVRNLIDVDQSTPLRSQGGSNYAVSASGTSSTGDTLTPTTAADDLVLDLIAVSTTPTIGSGQTLAGYGTQPTNQRSSTRVATGGSENMAWTYSSGTFAHCAVSIVGDAATQPGPEDYTGSRGKKSWHVQSQIVSGETYTVAGGAIYIPVGPSVESTNLALEPLNRLAARVPGTWADPTIYVSVNTLTSSATVTLLDDGVATGMTITVPAGTTGRFTGSGSAPVDGTTGISWEFTGGTSGGATITMLAASFEPDGADTVTVLSAHSSSASQIPAGATNYMGVSGARSFVGSVADAGLVLPMGCVWRGLHVVTPDGNTTTGTVDIDSYINGAGGNQALAWAASENDSLEDTTNTDTVADGDIISWRAVVGAGTGTFEVERWASRLLNNDGEFLLVSMASVATSGIALNNGANYVAVAGEGGRTATEAAAQMTIPFDAAVKRLAIKVNTNTSLLPAVATLRVNGADTALSMELPPGIEGTLYSQIWDVVEVGAGDLVDINIQQAGANNTMRVAYVALVGVERSAAPSLPSLSASTYKPGTLTSSGWTPRITAS